jgi:hypothetical protein
VRGKIVGAMVYPLVIICVAIAVVTAVVLFIIPPLRRDLPLLPHHAAGRDALPARRQHLHAEVLVRRLRRADPADHRARGAAAARSQPYRYRVHQLLLKLPGVGPVLSRSLVASFAAPPSAR